jgi:tetratricopeptide (TPR) repeat protein
MLCKPELARNYLESAISIDPEHANAHHLLGYLLMRQGQPEEAIGHFNNTLVIDPQHIPAYKDLGYLYLATNRPDKARAALDAAIALQPNNLEVNIVLAKLFDQQGDLQAAYDLVVPHIERGTLHVDLGIVFASLCRHFGRCEEAADYLEKIIKLSEHSPARNEHLYFALGALYDRLGNYDRAFENFEKGNLKRSNAFDAIGDAGNIDRLIKTCDWNFFVSAPRSSQTTDSPVFIVGMPRSGSTLVEQILVSHPDVEGVGEVSVIPNIIATLSDVPEGGAAYPDNLKNLTTRKLDILANRYLDGIRRLVAGNAPRVTDKTLVNFMHLGLISLMFPKARVVHCMRDPRDTCLSIFFKNFDESHHYANRLDSLGTYYAHYRKVMRHWESLRILPIFNIQYEDMVQNQEARSRELIEFLGLKWNDQALKFYETKRSVATASYDQVRQKMYTQSMQRWKNYEKHLDPLIKALEPVSDSFM